MSSEGSTRFWDLAGAHLASGACDEGTMMGNPCLRAKGAFVAMYWEKGGGMIVKLDAKAVRRHIADGRGQAFVPNGRVFKEWLAVPDASEWGAVLAEALKLAGR